MNCDCKNCDPWMMTADSFTAQNQIREFNPDSTTHSSGEPVIECDSSSLDTTSKEGDVQDHIVSSLVRSGLLFRRRRRCLYTTNPR